MEQSRTTLTKSEKKAAPARKKVTGKTAAKSAKKDAANTVSESGAAKPARKSRARKSPATNTPALPSSEERRRMVAEAAYFLSLKRGDKGDATGDWLRAEQQIESMFTDSN